MTGDKKHGCCWVANTETCQASVEVERLNAERAELRELGKAVNDYWRHEMKGKPPGTPSGISTPGMRLLLAVLK